MRSAPASRRVVIVEDQTAIVELMKAAIEAAPGYRVIGQAGDIDAARELCSRERPGLVVLDLALPSGSGLSLLGELRAVCPRARVIIFSANLRPGTIRAAMLAGAHGLVEKTAPLRELHEALQAVAEGQVYYSRFASEAIRQIVHGGPRGRNRLVRLTDREKSVLRAVAEGLSGKEISARLGISRHTVAGCRARLSRKSGLRGAARLARLAVQLGLVPDRVEGAAEMA